MSCLASLLLETLPLDTDIDFYSALFVVGTVSLSPVLYKSH